jgi:hypothetical protein
MHGSFFLVPFIEELTNCSPWDVVMGCLISANFIIRSTRFGSTSRIGDVYPICPPLLFLGASSF